MYHDIEAIEIVFIERMQMEGIWLFISKYVRLGLNTRYPAVPRNYAGKPSLLLLPSLKAGLPRMTVYE